MHSKRTTSSRSAFTLIEILVVVAIIGLLVAALLPAFGVVRTKARYAQAQAQYSALSTGLEMFRGESDLGGSYPPSASDYQTDRQIIADPRGSEGNKVRIAGAHLLVHAMIGADMLGTPGFRDFDRDGQWWDDTYRDPLGSGGAYALDNTTGHEGETMRTRYGGAGYVDDKMKQRTKSLGALEEEGNLLNLSGERVPDDIARDELLFVDPWGTPVLYYKANIAALRIVADSDRSGIYRQEDNGIITGTDENPAGLDFGPGAIGGHLHAISDIPPLPDGDPDAAVNTILTNDDYVDSFVRFILDPSVLARPTPVRKDSYLLIGAGPDARYGTDDDVTNWTREKD